MLVCLVNSSIVDAQEITLKYFESGHTFTSADSVHHGVEQQKKQTEDGNVYDLNDFAAIIGKSNGAAMNVIEMKNEDFLDWHGEQSQQKLKAKERSMLADLVEVKFVCGKQTLGYF